MTTRRVGFRTDRVSLSHVRLYRDELEQIAAAVAEVGDLSILCDDWEMTNPDDFSTNKELPERLPPLRIAAEGDVTENGRPKRDIVMAVTLSAEEATVSISEPSTLTEGVLSRIRRIVAPHKRRWAWIRMGASARDIFASFSAIGGFLSIVISMAPLPAALFSPLMIGAFFVVFIRSRRIVSSAVLINAYRKDRPSFWQRTRDDWVVSTVMLLLGAAVGGVVGYYINQIQ